MIRVLEAVGLVGLTGGWFLLPFIPALQEWRRKTDATPLPIPNDHDGNVRQFARGFRAWLTAQLPGLVPMAVRDGAVEGRLSDGTEFLLLRGEGGPDAPALSPDIARGKVIFGAGPLDLPARFHAEREVYAAQSLRTGPGSVFRAIVADGDVTLDRGNVVLRWLHGESNVRVGAGSRLFGRVSAEREMRIAEGCAFERVHARHIEFGGPPEWPKEPLEPPALAPFSLEGRAEASGGRWLVHGPLDIPAGAVLTGDVVARGAVRVGARARIVGSLKGQKDVTVEPGATIEGSVVSTHAIHFQEGSHAAGPVIADVVQADTGTRFGSPEKPTTITARIIRLARGVAVSGTVWAKESGSVAAAEEGTHA